MLWCPARRVSAPAAPPCCHRNFTPPSVSVHAAFRVRHQHSYIVHHERRHSGLVRLLAQQSEGTHFSTSGSKKTARQWKWAPATVVENRSESANGQLRSLTLSVQDHVTILEGRKMGRKPKDARWVDALEVPGQFLGLCEGADAPDADAQPTKLFSIASSPYDAKRNSSMLDAALVEVLVDRAGDEVEARLSQLAPGSVVHVTQVVGSGFGTLFSEAEGLLLAMEEGHNLVMIGAGTQYVGDEHMGDQSMLGRLLPHHHQHSHHTTPRGLASLRACVEWTPVQAHATTRAVSLFILADSPQAVAYVKDFDNWRAAGVRVHPIYCHPMQLAQQNGGTASLSPRELLERELFPSDSGGSTVNMWSVPCTVLMSGLTPDLMSSLTKRLMQAGVPVQNILCAGDM